MAGVRTGGAHRTDDAAVLKTDDLKVAAADRGGSGIVAGATCEPLDPCSVFDQVARAMNGPGKLRCIGSRTYCNGQGAATEIDIAASRTDRKSTRRTSSH